MASNYYFIDTSALVAKMATRDQNHLRAQELGSRLEQTGQIPLTTDYVLDETLTTLKVKTNQVTAIEFAKHIYVVDLKIAYTTPKMFKEALNYFIRHPDKGYSLTDCVSFVVMLNFKIKKVFTFDHHFEQAGFSLIK